MHGVLRIARSGPLAVLLVAGFWQVHAQNAGSAPSGANSSAGTSNSVRITGLDGGFGNQFPSYDPNISHRQLVARREELHRHMLDNAARLLSLTRELQEDLQLHEANGADAKRLDDIGKLARTVRDQMRQ